MKKYLIVLILLATASVSNGQSAVANQEKYKIVASAAAYNQSYPYFGVLNFSLTDLGSSIARVILPSQDHKFVKIDASGQIQNLTTSSSNSNADGHTIVVEGIAMSQNEQFYYYYYADYITINNSWILAQLSINNGILATSYIYAASANQNLYNTIATNNKGTVATVVENSTQ